jgi:tRNA U34 2-thiouridine synthase MnmA/TrmU
MSTGHEIEILETNLSYIRARFTQPVRAITPGQICVFYEDDIIVAAGLIV